MVFLGAYGSLPDAAIWWCLRTGGGRVLTRMKRHRSVLLKIIALGHGAGDLGLTGQRRVSTKAEFKSGRMLAARAPKPIMHVTLLSGRDLVPPKFLGERSSMMFLFASAAKITVSNSSTKSRSFASVKTSEPKTSLKAWRFLLPASLFT